MNRREERGGYLVQVSRLSAAQRTMSWNDDIAFVRASRASMFSLAVDGGANEMCARVLTRRVDVVVLGVFAHDSGYDGVRLNLLSVSGCYVTKGTC